MAVILNLAILDSAILVFPLKVTHTCQDWFPLFSQKKLHSFILTQLGDISQLDLCHLVFSNLHKKLHSCILTQIDDYSHLEFCYLGFSHFAQKKNSLVHSDSTWSWQSTWILPCWIHTLPSWIQKPCYLLSDSLKNTLPQLWPWLKLIPSD